MTLHTLIIGGGPAGLMTASTLSQHNIPFLLLEKNERVGKKILITGGKRSNVTNVLSKPAFVDALTLKHKRFCYSVIESFGPSDVIAFFHDRGLALELQDGFKYFPATNKAQSVIDALLVGVDPQNIVTQENVISIEKTESSYHVKTLKNAYEATNVVVATGSKSFPTTGSNGDGLKFAHALDIPYKPFTPAETSVYTKADDPILSSLQGVALDNVGIYLLGDKKPLCTGAMIVTHFGLSGPAIFHASEFIYEALEVGNHELRLNLISRSEEDWLRQIRDALLNDKTLGAFLESELPKRWVQFILQKAQLDKQTRQLANADLTRLILYLTQFPITLERVEYVERAYVNKGGIDTLSLSPKTLEVKNYPGLYFIGETVDLHGPIGGFNITLALSMGRRVGTHIASQSEGFMR